MTIPNQKTFLMFQQEISEEVLGFAYGTLPGSTDRPSLTRLKQEINDAYAYVCASSDWWWLNKEGTFNTVVGQTTPYAVTVNAQNVQYLSINLQQQYLQYWPYSDWRNLYPGGYTNMANSRPVFFTDAPTASDDSLQFYLGPSPADQIYAVSYFYKLRAVPMSADGDYPSVPATYQDLILYRALVRIYSYLGDGSRQRMLDRQAMYQELWNRAWLADQTPSGGSNRMRDWWKECMQSSWADINRALFVPF